MCIDCVSLRNYSRQCQMLAAKYGITYETIRHTSWERPYRDMMDPEDAVKQFVGNLGHEMFQHVKGSVFGKV